MTPDTHSYWPSVEILESLILDRLEIREMRELLRTWLDRLELPGNRLLSLFSEKLRFMHSEGILTNAQYQIMEALFDEVFEPTYEVSPGALTAHMVLVLCARRMGEPIPDLLRPYLLDEDSILPEGQEPVPEETERGFLTGIDGQVLEFSLSRAPSYTGRIPFRNVPDGLIGAFRKATAILGFPVPVYWHGLRKKSEEWTIDTAVIYPDYLVDVTAVANCYVPGHSSALRYLIDLFRYSPSSKHMLIGTAVNEFLDELIIHPDAVFEPMIAYVFRKYPFAISLLSEAEVQDFLNHARFQFDNLKLMTQDGFGGLIRKEDACQLEPSYYSVVYGIQGRLDVLVETGDKRTIIELKSGKPYNTDDHGINPAHAAQAQLYELLIRSAHGAQVLADRYLLYSSQKDQALRHSPSNPGMVRELIDIRNSIVLIQLHLANTGPQDRTLLDSIKPEAFDPTDHFVRRDGISWLQTWYDLDPLSRAYVRHFCFFTAREQLISKTGLAGQQQGNGLADLWLKSGVEKEQAYQAIGGLSIHQVTHHELDSPIVELVSDRQGSLISAFRQGDTLVLFPEHPDGQGALRHQVYKCTLIDINPNACSVRLRGRQFDSRPYAPDTRWVLEPDVLDRSFLYMYENLWEWARAPVDFRRKILGVVPAEIGSSVERQRLNLPEGIDAIIGQALDARDYFLIWGPPGSGKTSVVIRALVEQMILTSDENILLLAYTNRAVDEICEALESLEDEDLYSYIRIGSRYGVSEKFHRNLLDQKLRQVANRKQLRQMLKGHRIFTATVASILGKKELFELFQFDTVIIDEASQILEPNLVGLLTRFKKFILIGDHMQLPAVSAQPYSGTQIQDEALRQLGFRSSSHSFFDRLYHRCTAEGWTHSFAMLTRQGRMHRDIMEFPSERFYQNRLELMDERPDSRQVKPLSERFPQTGSVKAEILARSRTVFVPVPADDSGAFSKVQPDEAVLVAGLVEEIKKLYYSNNLPFTDQSIGIMSPFRAQNAEILSALIKAGIDPLLQIKIDTVERYQGSAREVIIFSCCAHSAAQLAQISQSDSDGINRKLNVALTRAREQVIVLGDPEILKDSPDFTRLMESYDWWKTGE